MSDLRLTFTNLRSMETEVVIEFKRDAGLTRADMRDLILGTILDLIPNDKSHSNLIVCLYREDFKWSDGKVFWKTEPAMVLFWNVVEDYNKQYYGRLFVKHHDNYPILRTVKMRRYYE